MQKEDLLRTKKQSPYENNFAETKVANTQTIYFDKNGVMYTSEEVKGLKLNLTKMVVKTPSEKP